MGLFVRMALYALFSGMSGYGFGTLDPSTNDFTVNIDQLAQILGGAFGFVATFVASRIAKRNGGAT